jgi:antitoxin (DNA-binding transcriptional repressor) of toxin-antitoxin stability system
MARYVGAKEFRERFSNMVKDLKQAREIVVLKTSKPLFKVVPFEQAPSDLLDRASAVDDNTRPDLQEISRIVHELRGAE